MKSHMRPTVIIAVLAWVGGCDGNSQPPNSPPPQPGTMQPNSVQPGQDDANALPPAPQSQQLHVPNGSTTESPAAGTERYPEPQSGSSSLQGFEAADGNPLTESDPTKDPVVNPFPAENDADFSFSDELGNLGDIGGDDNATGSDVE